eukprot:jgi/Mesvir1/28319/Mv04840-RA.1
MPPKSARGGSASSAIRAAGTNVQDKKPPLAPKAKEREKAQQGGVAPTTPPAPESKPLGGVTATEDWALDRIRAAGFDPQDQGRLESLSLPGYGKQTVAFLGASLRGFTSLRALDLSRNGLTTLEGLHYCAQLEKLNLYFNCIASTQEIVRLKANSRLQELDIRLNPVTRTVPDYRSLSIYLLPSLRRLDLRDVRVGDRRRAEEKYSRATVLASAPIDGGDSDSDSSDVTSISSSASSQDTSLDRRPVSQARWQFEGDVRNENDAAGTARGDDHDDFNSDEDDNGSGDSCGTGCSACRRAQEADPSPEGGLMAGGLDSERGRRGGEGGSDGEGYGREGGEAEDRGHNAAGTGGENGDDDVDDGSVDDGPSPMGGGRQQRRRWQETSLQGPLDGTSLSLQDAPLRPPPSHTPRDGPRHASDGSQRSGGTRVARASPGEHPRRGREGGGDGGGSSEEDDGAGWNEVVHEARELEMVRLGPPPGEQSSRAAPLEPVWQEQQPIRQQLPSRPQSSATNSGRPSDPQSWSHIQQQQLSQSQSAPTDQLPGGSRRAPSGAVPLLATATRETSPLVESSPSVDRWEQGGLPLSVANRGEGLGPGDLVRVRSPPQVPAGRDALAEGRGPEYVFLPGSVSPLKGLAPPHPQPAAPQQGLAQGGGGGLPLARPREEWELIFGPVCDAVVNAVSWQRAGASPHPGASWQVSHGYLWQRDEAVKRNAELVLLGLRQRWEAEHAHVAAELDALKEARVRMEAALAAREELYSERGQQIAQLQQQTRALSEAMAGLSGTHRKEGWGTEPPQQQGTGGSQSLVTITPPRASAAREDEVVALLREAHSVLLYNNEHLMEVNERLRQELAALQPKSWSHIDTS